MDLDFISAKSWIEKELKALEAAPSLNGCEMTDEWAEAIAALKTALRAICKLEEVKAWASRS